MGGLEANVSTPDLNQIYDTETDSWTMGEPVPNPVTNAVAGVTTGEFAPKRIYVLGGRINGAGSESNFNQVYNPEADSWEVGAAMPTARYSFAVAVINDTLYALGGYRLNNPSPKVVTLCVAKSVNFIRGNSLAVNEQYTPIDYGTISSPSPSPLLSPSESPSPTPAPTLPSSETPSSSPSAYPSLSASDQQPASSPEPNPTAFPTELIYAAVAVAAAILAVSAVAIVFKRKK
jgi:hypothetical protein